MHKNKDSKQKILASLVMGINCVNSFAPMAMAINIQQPASVETKPTKEAVAEPEQYTAACYQALDSAIFGTAEAAFTVSVGAGMSVTGETVENLGEGSKTQTVYAGGTTTDGVIKTGGTQIINGGTGNVATMTGGSQNVVGGTGSVGAIEAGSQNISAGGIGYVGTMNGGNAIQDVVAGGTSYMTSMVSGKQQIWGAHSANITSMLGGNQLIYWGGTGTVDEMNGSDALQKVDSGLGTIGTLSQGKQVISAGAVGSVSTMFGGIQSNAGLGYVTTISGGTQSIVDGTGSVVTMYGGKQDVGSNLSGHVDAMSGGVQNVWANATGTINTMSDDGQQIIYGSGHIVTMSKGQQFISAGVGTIDTMSGGTQTISAGVTGSITTIEGSAEAIQQVYDGAKGFITTLNNVSGSQTIEREGIGNIETLQAGIQAVYDGGQGIIKDITGTEEAGQKVSSGGTGTIATMDNISAVQTIEYGGSGEIATLQAGQQIVSGYGYVDNMQGGTQEVFSATNAESGGIGEINVMSGGTQKIKKGAQGSITSMTGNVAVSQSIEAGGTGTVTTMDNTSAVQGIASGASGSITTLKTGLQTVAGSGTIDTMSGGTQNINSTGTGNVDTMSGGTQYVYSSGTGKVGTMSSGGTQYIYSGATGTVTTMNDYGLQNIELGGTGTVITMMNSGFQHISSGGTGTVATMSGGTQRIDSDGTGNVTTMNGGTQSIVDSDGIGNITTMNGGSQLVAFASATGNIDTMNNGVQYINNHAIGSVNTMNGGNQNIKTGGTGIVTALNAGRQNVEGGGSSLNTSVNGGTLAVFGDTAVIENTTIDTGKIIFNGSGGNYKLSGNFIARGGTVDLTVNVAETSQVPATYETLTIDNLSGNGTNFIMNTDLNSETNGDKLVVQAAAPNAGGSIQVYDKSLVDGTNVLGPKKLLMVTDNSGVTTWTGKSLDTGGLWTITPNIIKEGNDWFLYLSDKPTLPNEVAQTNIGFTNAAYGAWRSAITDDTLRMRLGDLRYNEAEDGVWARAKAGKMDASGFTGSYQMYQVGMDKKLANTVYGVAVDHMIGSNDYLDGNGKNSMTNLSLYATNYHPSGVYSDIVVKAGKYRSDLNVNSTNDAADYNAWGYSASYEIGKTIAKENGFFIEPEAQFVLGKLQGADYTSNEGISVDRDGSTSFLGRLGFVAGRKLSNAGDYYFKASVWREFAGSGDINLSAVNNFGNKERMMESIDHKDTWFELGFGGNVKLAKMTHLYGDVVKTFGADIQKKWQVNAGVRWGF